VRSRTFLRLVFGNSQAASSSVQDIYDARSGAAAGEDIRSGHLGDCRGGDGFVGPTQRGRLLKSKLCSSRRFGSDGQDEIPPRDTGAHPSG
jgi:hypothetical protein